MLFPLPQPPIKPQRVVVTGAGIVTALGTGWEDNCRGFKSGRRAFRPVTLFDVSRQRAHEAAEVGPHSSPSWLPHTKVKMWRRFDRSAQMLLLAAGEAFIQSGWETSLNSIDSQNSESLPVPWIVATTSGGMSQGEAFFKQTVATPADRQHQATRALEYQSRHQVFQVAQCFGTPGPLTVIANACASGANAIGHAFEILRSGRANRAFAGGYDALSQLVYAGFDALQALSTTQCRPFDNARDGLGLGEGAAIIAMETLDHAQKRNAHILGEIVGYGSATDLHHLTQPHPEGDAARMSMEAACRMADLTPGQIDYINAHGTGTPHNDASEARAITRWAGSRAVTIPVSSVKSAIGHSLGAAGAIEVVACLMALRHQWLPPTINLTEPDPLCSFPIVREPTSACLEYVLTNSFGFGGANASMILRRMS